MIKPYKFDHIKYRMFTVDSDWVDQVGYDTDNHILLVTTLSGDSYIYTKVNPVTAINIITSKSVGEALNTYISNRNDEDFSGMCFTYTSK